MRLSSRRIAAIVGAIVLILVIIWVDVQTQLWQEFVILAGLAAGLITFLLTVLFVDDAVARGAAKRWAPVTRLALTEILHGLSDEERSEPSMGLIVARRLTAPTITDTRASGAVGNGDLKQQSHLLRVAVVEERQNLATALGAWANFLASSDDNVSLMRRIARFTLHLESVRDLALELDEAIDGAGDGGAVTLDQHRPATSNEHPLSNALTQLQNQVETCNAELLLLVDDIKAQLASEKLESADM